MSSWVITLLIFFLKSCEVYKASVLFTVLLFFHRYVYLYIVNFNMNAAHYMMSTVCNIIFEAFTILK